MGKSLPVKYRIDPRFSLSRKEGINVNRIPEGESMTFSKKVTVDSANRMMHEEGKSERKKKAIAAVNLYRHQ